MVETSQHAYSGFGGKNILVETWLSLEQKDVLQIEPTSSFLQQSKDLGRRSSFVLEEKMPKQ
jgi:hypothetical protein